MATNIKPAQIDLVRTSMDGAAGSYLHNRWTGSSIRRWDHEHTRRALMSELQIRPDDRVLEIGCGAGAWTRLIGPNCLELTAIDVSPNMIAEAQRNTVGGKVNFLCGDFLQVPINGQFDKIYSLRVLEYIEDLRGFVDKVSRLLAPGGKVVIVTKPRTSIWRGRTRLLYRGRRSEVHPNEGTSATETGRVIQYMRNPSTISAAFRERGFAVSRVRPAVMRFPFFKNGFHEFPIINERMSSFFLSVCSFSEAVLTRAPHFISRWALVFSETYCISLEGPG